MYTWRYSMRSVGDLPAACEVPRSVLFDSLTLAMRSFEVEERIYKSYDITPPVSERFTLNLGAIQAIEKLCCASIPYIYVSEHSCEARVPKELTGLLELTTTGIS